jgi:enoyl-CoA hydratase
MTDVLEVEDRGSVRWIWFNRPDVHNAQNVAMLRRLEEELDRLRADRSVRVVVIAGRGKSFCSGHDLREMADNPAYAERSSTAEGRYRQEMELFVDPVRRIQDLDVPVLCRVQGHCLAAGMMFVAAADLVIAATDASFGSPVLERLAVNDAEVPGFAWLLGERRAKQAIWLSERITADDALRYGMVNWVVPGEALDAKVTEVAEKLVAMPPEALMLSKAGFRFLARRQGFDDFAAFHYVSHQLSHHTTEARTLLDDRVEGGGATTSR